MKLATNYFSLRLLLFLIYLINGVIIISQNSVTNDEMDHWSYGKRVLMKKPEKIYPYDDASTMPISGLNAIPRAAQQLIDPGLRKEDGGFSDIMNGRYVTLIVCLLIGVYIYKWSKDLFGEKAGLFSLFLFVFCPNINANATLLTTDAYSALFTLTTAYYFRRFLQNDNWRDFILFSINLGIAQVVKQSLLLLLIYFTVASIVILIQRKSLLKSWMKNLLRFVVLIAIMLFIINAAFLFRGSGTPFSQYEFGSGFFKNLQISFIGALPMPLPSPFVYGYDLVKQLLDLGSGHENVSARSYLFGEYFTGGKWYYYPVIFFFKTPIPVLILLITTIILFGRRKGVLYPLSIAAFFMVFFMLFNSSQHSLRHLVMIFPLIYVAVGALITTRFFKKWVLAVFILYSLATYYFYFPNLISYTNEFILPKKNAYRILASSNIDYGQCKDLYESYLKKHPDVRVPGEVPQAGNYIIGINYYLDLEGQGKYAWLQKYKPYGHVNHCLLLVRVIEQDLQNGKPE